MKEKYKQLVDFYIKAKDRHQPHLMELAFAKDATLKMVVNTDTISFPAETVGLENITRTLVKEFHNRFDNVYTFCVTDSIVELSDIQKCTWLVGMTDAQSGALRIGYGEYHWEFSEQDTADMLRVSQLTIVIKSMIVAPKESASLVLPWLDSLQHPWITRSELSLLAPDISTIQEFLKTGWRVEV